MLRQRWIVGSFIGWGYDTIVFKSLLFDVEMRTTTKKTPQMVHVGHIYN